MEKPSLIILVLVAVLSSLAPMSLAASPVDLIAAPLQEKMNISPEELQKKAIEHIAQGNLTGEHISQDLNATGEQLKEAAAKHINQSINTSLDQLSQRAKEELKSQLGQKVQPGFETLFALAGILGAALILRRRS
jgi:PGF-CTERM protein